MLDSVNCLNVDVFTDPYPCGQTKTIKTKREADFYGGTYDGIDDGMFLDDFQNFSIPILQPHPPNEALPNKTEDNSDSNPDTRVVGGSECSLGQCPWQVNVFVMCLVMPCVA